MLIYPDEINKPCLRQEPMRKREGLERQELAKACGGNME